MAYYTNGNGLGNGLVNGLIPVPHHEASVPGAMLSPNTAEEAEILAAMDKLRALGIDRTYDLPQIIVCGSQSAGKSSVLESLIQVPFPRDEKTCTKYVTKVTILPADAHRIEVRIQPGGKRKPAEVKMLNDFLVCDDSPEYATKLGELMREADKTIFHGVDIHKVTFTQDTMLITVYGPGTRPLQVLDLPGLIAYDQKGQGNEQLIEAIVRSNMKVNQSIILAVIKANEDLNNQPVLKLCKEYDPEGQRTMGIITRPDVAEDIQKRNIIAVINKDDKDFQFQHRWHILRNRAFEERDTSQEERDSVEERLLNSHPWNTVDRKSRGIAELRERLRELLFDLAKRTLPDLCDTFRARLDRLREEFNALGGDEFEPDQLEKAVDASLERLQQAARDHARGIYESDVRGKFGENKKPENLRSRVVERSEVFRDRLVEDGHAWNTKVRLTPLDPDHDLGSIYREAKKEEDHNGPSQPKKTYPNLEAEIHEVAKMLEGARDDNLATFFNSQRIKELFWYMSEGWNAIAEAHVNSVYDCCEEYFDKVTHIAFRRAKPDVPWSGFANPARVAGRFVVPHVIPKLQACRDKALKELSRLEEDRLAAPINADKRFLKDRRAHRQQRGFERVMQASHHFSSSSSSSPPPSDSPTASRLDPTSYAEKAGLHSQWDLTKDTAETYLDAMWSHYLIERDIYITNVLRQVIERHFLRDIAKILPKSLSDAERKELVKNETAEEVRKEQIRKDVNVLEESLKALQKIRRAS